MRSLMIPFVFAALVVLVPGCSKKATDPEPKSFRIDQHLTVDGRLRHYILDLPPNYYDSSNFSLVLALHGTGGSALQCAQDYKLSEKARSAKFVIAYPEGVRSNGVLGIRTWNAGGCCDFAQNNNINDVKFISLLIDTLLMKYNLNPKRVYVTGMSNGAMMAYRLGSELSNKIAAIAPVSGTLFTTQSYPSVSAVPLLHIHSALDTKVPYAGGQGLGGYYFPPVDSALNVWADRNGCDASPVVITENEKFKHTVWMNCNGNRNIECYLTKDGGHSWPGGRKSGRRGDDPSTALDATNLIWDFFSRYELP